MSNNGVTDDINRLATLMYGVAEHWLSLSKDELRVLGDVCSDFTYKPLGPDKKTELFKRSEGSEQASVPQQTRRMLAWFRSDKRVRDFLALPETIKARCAACLPLSWEAAHASQMALMLDLAMRLLIPLPVLARIEIKRHVVDEIENGIRVVRLVFSQQEVRSEQMRDVRLLPRQIEMLDFYCAHTLSVLCPRGSRFLFPGRGDRPKCPGLFAQQLSAFITEETRHFDGTGVRVTPRQFRYLSGFFHLLRHPDDYETVQRVLGHRKRKTTVRIFKQFVEGRAAFAMFDEGVERGFSPAANTSEESHR